MTRRDIRIETGDGSARAVLFTPADAGRRPGVLMYMDAVGLRPAMEQMAQRLADAGYTVLLPDLFYRGGDYPPLDVKEVMQDEALRRKVFEVALSLPSAKTMEDTATFLDVLAEHATGPFGVVGYCMGGTRALSAAAAHPDRIAAAAIFHGGHLATDKPDSPHLGAASIKARLYVGCAGVDGSFPPEQSARLTEALRSAEVDFMLENYPGVQHGWTVPDSPAYNRPAAERHFARLTTLLGETLENSTA